MNTLQNPTPKTAPMNQTRATPALRLGTVRPGFLYGAGAFTLGAITLPYGALLLYATLRHGPVSFAAYAALAGLLLATVMLTVAARKKAAKARAATGKTARKPRPPEKCGLGWEDPYQTWSPFWLFTLVILAILAVPALYLTRDWGAFRWVVYIVIARYALPALIGIWEPQPADLRTLEQKIADYEEANATPNGQFFNNAGVPWSMVTPVLRGTVAGNWEDPFEESNESWKRIHND